MKITREFWFYPSWHSWGWSGETTDDLFPIPKFNAMAKILNDRGWEIDYSEIKDGTIFGYHNHDMKEARFICSKRVKGEFKEENYTYIACGKNGEVKDGYY